ncbi:acyl-CoA dehydrogenase family protein [Thauera butanivorans]|jgi:alkylation response protein AidB-like acyl-CoA dehydrogenase|uniref:acyl-CoA dehydrogenase family protein n=1 Tax=Thauera butanivorans TaxID=86174 RepID=UPI00083901A8|nr:acyl-CoA dehydrogenase family protein [Thauera butanivorans]
MDLKFTDEQNMLRDMTRDLCSDYSGIDVVRAMENDPVGMPADLWAQMQQTGLLGMRIPEAHGGMGLSLLDCAVIYEQLGRFLAPGPYFDSTLMSAGALVHAGDGAWQAELLPAIAAGEQIVVPAWLEADGGFGPAGVQLRAQPDGDHYLLEGVKRHVFHARAAHRLLVLARTGEGAEAISLFVVDADSPGLHYEQQRSMASDTQYKLTFDKVRIPRSARVGAEHAGWAAWNAAMREGIVLLAAWAAGGAERALEITVQYSKDREQFGKPIGAFQALAHYMADASTVVEGARTLVLEAAWAHAAGKPIDRLAPMAKLFAAKAFRDVTAMAQQVHGGIGFTLDYDIQLYYRRAKQLQMNWWDSRHLEDLVAAAVLDGSGRSIDDPFTV